MQTDGVMMESPLGALFANIFICKLVNTIIPSLGDKVRQLKRYVDDTFTFIKPNTEQEIQLTLNLFHENIKFAYKLEQHNNKHNIFWCAYHMRKRQEDGNRC